MLKVFEQKKTSAIPFAYRYLLSLPDAYESEKQEKYWPLLLFLHGAGELHGPIEKVLNHGPPKLVHAYSSSKETECSMDNVNMECARLLAENFIMCSPQVDQGDEWDATTLSALLDDLEQTYRIDKNRIYVTGISMGRLLERRSNRFYEY
jgi:predicted peptidase